MVFAPSVKCYQVVFKEKSPVIHFVIHHKKMIRAFQNFVPPLVEQ